MSILTPDETILGLLAAQPQHGYQLLETFNQVEGLGKVWSLSTSQIYAVLKRLERLAWIIGTQVTSEAAPTRTEYTITPEGQTALQVWLHEPHPSASIRRVRVEFLSRLYVAQRLKLPNANIILHQRNACDHERSRMVSLQAKQPKTIGGLATDFVISQLEAVLQWIEHIEVTLLPTQS